MECHVYLGGPSRFELQGAILVYGGGNAQSRSFASWHEIQALHAGTPHLGPARPLSVAFLRELSRGLGTMARPEVLPENVLVRIPDCLVWWRPQRRERMFFRHDDELYYNVNIDGVVCQGTMRSPTELTVASMGQWERAFFESEFTHIYGSGHFTRCPGGIVGLWKSLEGKRLFPRRLLVPTVETLAQFAAEDQGA
jgi:hypothetical protein